MKKPWTTLRTLSVLTDFPEALVTAPAWKDLDPLELKVYNFVDDHDVSDKSGGCLELPWVLAAVRTTNSDIGEVAHKLCYDRVVVTTHHRLETSLRVRLESCLLILGEDSPTQWVFEFDREARVLLP